MKEHKDDTRSESIIICPPPRNLTPKQKAELEAFIKFIKWMRAEAENSKKEKKV